MAAWPSQCAELRDLLDLQDVNGMTCHGYARTTQTHTCRNPIARANTSKVPRILQEIVSAGKLDTHVWQHLQNLASIVLCRRWHQDQADTKARSWWTSLSSPSLATLQASETQASCRPSVTARSRASTQRIPNTTSQRSYDHDRNQGIPSQASRTTTTAESSNTDNSPPSANTRSRIAQRTTPPSHRTHSQEARLAEHKLIPYGSQNSIYQINHRIRNALLRTLQGTELSLNGAIYGHTYPPHHRVADEPAIPYIKIGFSNNVTRRMTEWQRQCHYTPQLEFALDMPHYGRMEKVVHCYLHNSRKRELDCPGCGGTHVEWFAVSADLVKGVVLLWQRWAQTRPYDDTGHLSETWRRRLERLKLSDPWCWIRFIDGPETVDNPQTAGNANNSRPRRV